MFIWPEPNLEFTPGTSAPPAAERNWYFVFAGPNIHMNLDDNGQWQPLEAMPDAPLKQSHYLGDLAGVHCHAVEIESGGDDFVGLRGLFGKTDNLTFSLAGRAIQVLDWYRSHQYCGRCGNPTEPHDRDRAMVCHDCRNILYPRLSPSIITLIHREDEMLLARSPNFPEGMYSTLAGFVEPGESIEQTLSREVFEEVGVRVKNLEYLGSQPWPFPNSLMLGFLAEYESGELNLQEDEIADAQWFHHEDLPKLPGPVAISRWLIDMHLQRLQAR